MIKYTQNEYLDFLPNNILNSEKLRNSAKVILGSLISAEGAYSTHNNNKGYFHVANSTLMELTEFSKPTLIKELNCLINLGLINRISGKAHTQSHYTLNWNNINNFEVKLEVKSEVKLEVNHTLPQSLPQSLPQTLPIEYSIIEDRIQNLENRIKNLEEKLKEKDDIIINLLKKEELKEEKGFLSNSILEIKDKNERNEINENLLNAVNDINTSIKEETVEVIQLNNNSINDLEDMTEKERNEIIRKLDPTKRNLESNTYAKPTLEECLQRVREKGISGAMESFKPYQNDFASIWKSNFDLFQEAKGFFEKHNTVQREESFERYEINY